MEGKNNTSIFNINISNPSLDFSTQVKVEIDNFNLELLNQEDKEYIIESCEELILNVASQYVFEIADKFTTSEISKSLEEIIKEKLGPKIRDCKIELILNEHS